MSQAAARVALITGATGFTGSRLARALLEQGWTVHAIVRPNSSTALLGDCASRIQLHIHDGSTEGLVKIVGAAKPDVVFHLAALFVSQHGPADVLPLVQHNIAFSAQLAEAMAQNGVTRLLNTGSSWQHFGNADYSPANLYAATKQAFEVLLQYYREACGFSVTTLHLYDSYGPGDPRPKLFHLLRQAENPAAPLKMSAGEQLIDLVYIDDVTNAFVLAAQHLLAAALGASDLFAVSSGQPRSLRQLVEQYATITGRSVHIEWGGRPYRTREVMVPWNCGTPVPGWQPRTSFADGLAKMLAAPAQKG